MIVRDLLGCTGLGILRDLRAFFWLRVFSALNGVKRWEQFSKGVHYSVKICSHPSWYRKLKPTTLAIVLGAD